MKDVVPENVFLFSCRTCVTVSRQEGMIDQVRDPWCHSLSKAEENTARTLYGWLMFLSVSLSLFGVSWVTWALIPASLVITFGPADPAGRLEDVERADIVSRFTVLRALPLLSFQTLMIVFLLLAGGAVRALWPNLTPDLASVPPVVTTN